MAKENNRRKSAANGATQGRNDSYGTSSSVNGNRGDRDTVASGSGRRSASNSRGASRGGSRSSNNARINGANIVASGVNPPYALTPSLLELSSSFSFGRALGAPIDCVANDTEITPNSQTLMQGLVTWPGIMTFAWLPTIGISEDATSPVSLAARKLYYFVRHANSGHVNYDAADLMNYVVAADSAFLLFSYFRRALGMLNTWSPLNRYYAKYAMESAGFNYENLFSNAAELAFFLQQTAAKMRSLVLPAKLGFYQRHSALNDNIYADTEDARAQTYQFVPAGWYVWTEPVDDPSVTKKDWYLRFMPNPGITPIAAGGADSELLFQRAQRPDRAQRLLTLQDMRDIFNAVLEPLLLSEDFNIMSGDILKAYGSDIIVGVAEPPIGYTITPVYDQGMLDQIENMTILTAPVLRRSDDFYAQDPTFDIKQQNGLFLQFNPTISSYEYLIRKPVLNYHTGQASPERNIMATRFTVYPSSMTSATLKANDARRGCTYRFTAIGTELILSAWTTQFRFVPGSSVDDWTLEVQYKDVRTSNPIAFANDTVTETVEEYFARLASITRTSYFTSHPIQYIAASKATLNDSQQETSVVFQPIGYLSELNNFYVLQMNDIVKMHESAVLTLFFRE